MVFEVNFDFVISIGEDCGNTAYIRNFSLHDGSYPFDWLTNADFSTRINLICNDFKDFLNKEDFELLTDKYNEEHECYQNTKTNFYFYHDFHKNINFDDSFDIVKEKYQRRISRFYNRMQSSKNILLVWLSQDKKINNSDLLESYNKLSQKFTTINLYLLVLENDPTKDTYVYQYLNNNLLKICYKTATEGMISTMGNKKNTNYIFAQIQKKGLWLKQLKNKMQKIIINMLCAFIPIKKYRKKLRSYIVEGKYFDY